MSVWDWDRLGKNELIGRAVIGRTTIASLSKDGKGKSYFHKFTLQDPKGETVVGKDRENTELSVEIKVINTIALAHSATIQSAIHHEGMGFFQETKTATMASLGSGSSKTSLANEKFNRSFRKIALVQDVGFSQIRSLRDLGEAFITWGFV